MTNMRLLEDAVGVKKTPGLNVVDTVYGCILAIAASGKAWLLVNDEFASLRLGFPLVIILFAACLELAVAALLIGSTSIKLKTIIASCLSCVFIIVTLLRIYYGYNSCGCFGWFELPAWGSMLFNLIVLVAYAIRVQLHPHLGWAEILAYLRVLVANHPVKIGTSIVLVAASLAVWFSPLSPRLSAYFQGETVVFADKQYLGEVREGEKRFVPFRVFNWTNEDVQMVGAESSCECLVAEGTTDLIPADGHKILEARIRPKEPGWFKQRLVIYPGLFTKAMMVCRRGAVGVDCFQKFVFHCDR